MYNLYKKEKIFIYINKYMYKNMKKVKNNPLNKNIKFNLNEKKYSEFLLKIKEYKELYMELNDEFNGYLNNINKNSYIIRLLSKRIALGTNLIEKISVSEDNLESKLIINFYKNDKRDDIRTALNFLHEYENLVINWDDFKNEILKIHKRIFNNLKDKRPGKLRDKSYSILNQKEFLDPSLIVEELSKLGSFISNSNFSGIIVAALLNAKFIEIHPFTDGSARMGRLISNKIIQNFYEVPLWIDESISKTLTQYISALDSFYFDDNFSEIINYFIEMSINQIEINMNLIKNTREISRNLASKLKINHNQAIYLVVNKTINITRFSNKFQIHRNTAKSILDKAVELGYMDIFEESKFKIYRLK